MTTVGTGCGYNQIQELSEQARGARSEIEVQLQRQVDLVPNLLETVRGYASLDGDVSRSVADARAHLARVVRAGELGAMEEGNAELSNALRRLMEVVVRYPSLQADAGFRLLQAQLEGTEEQIATAGLEYNEAVQRYNDFIKQFPQVMTAKVIGARELPSFEPQGALASGRSTAE